MRLVVRRRRPPPCRPELVEIVTPRTNAATITPAENLLAAISLAEPFSLEIASTGRARWFLARAGSPAMRRHLEDQLGVAYPQAELRRLELDRFPALDPARVADDEQVAASTLLLRGPSYLPIRMFADVQVEAERSAQADPILGVLAATGELPEGWRTLSQLVLSPAPDDWCKDYLRLALQNPITATRDVEGGTPWWQIVALGGLIVGGAAVWQGYQWYEDGDWLNLLLLIGGIAAAVPGGISLARWLGDTPLHDPRLVQEKIGRIAYRAQLRLAVFAPADAPTEIVEGYLRRLTSAYRQYSLAAGNGFVATPLRLDGRELREPGPLPPLRSLPILNTRELAGLWHLPQSGADVPLVERTTARKWLPLPCTVARGCRIGASSHQGRVVPIALPDDLLRRHLLLVAKTRRGKSSLLLRLARYLMEEEAAENRRAVVLVDPHRDLAEAALGCVPVGRQRDVVYLDVANQERPFGLNLVDVGLGWDRDKAVDNVIDIFKREWDNYWGPRMEDAFRHALMTLYEANQALCNDAGGRDDQYTVLDVPTLMTEPAFRRAALAKTTDRAIKEWWRRYDRFDLNKQLEIINPVQTKVQRFAGSKAARNIVGQPRSTIDPSSWVRDGAIVIVNVAKGFVGQDTAALIGGTLLNLVALVVGEQARLSAPERRRVAVIVDEFQVMPGADYESFLAELPKYGASLTLATQSLARIEALDRQHERALREMVFANLDGLFAFHVSAEDARYLVHELGEEVDEHDLVAMGEHRCYARLSTGGERLPVFSVDLDRPPSSNPRLQAQLAAISSNRYGTGPTDLEKALDKAFARIDLARGISTGPAADGQKGDGKEGDGQQGDGKRGDGKQGDGGKGGGGKGGGEKGGGEKGGGRTGEGGARPPRKAPRTKNRWRGPGGRQPALPLESNGDPVAVDEAAADEAAG